MRDSSTRATGAPLPTCAQMLGKAYGTLFPLSGRLKISQSRSCPRPPRLRLPAATPPNGNAMVASCLPRKTRGYAIPGACGEATGFAGLEVEGVWAAAAGSRAACCRKERRAVAKCSSKRGTELQGRFQYTPLALVSAA